MLLVTLNVAVLILVLAWIALTNPDPVTDNVDVFTVLLACT